MNKRFQTNQRILTALAFHFAIVLMLSSAAIAAELLPNPNDGTIIVNDPVTNSVPFYNNLGGYITNNSTIQNYYDFYNLGIIDSYGTFSNNHAYLDNSGTFNNGLGGYIDNEGATTNTLTGTFNNQGYIDSDVFWNYGYTDNSGTIDNYGHLFNWGTFDNSGNVINGALTKNWGTFNNQGTINGSGAIVNELGGLTINDGIINNELWNYGTIINNNIIRSDLFSDNYGTIINSGTFESSPITNHGTLKGTGTFKTPNFSNLGIVAPGTPGNPTGTMTIDGHFTLSGSGVYDTGILEIEIGGFTPGLFDCLEITGPAFMDSGNINFSFLPGYDIVTDVGPGESREFSFLKAVDIVNFNSAINFDFTSLPYFQFNVFQNGNELVFDAINTTPLPSAVILGVIGVCCVSWLLKRKRMM
jgi:hypothetical protein